MNEQKVKELILAAGAEYHFSGDIVAKHMETFAKKLIELTMRECGDIVEQAKKSPFVSLDDAKRMSHFVDVTKKKIQKHFGVEE
jgi:hypothetical protein